MNMLQTGQSLRSVRMAMAAAMIAAAAMPHAQGVESNSKRAAVVLADVKWQALPQNVEAAYVAPDDRIWYRLSNYDRIRRVADFKQMIEREYPRPSPQFGDGGLLLFEPMGRVWFRFDERLRALPNLFLCGNSYHGVAMNACIKEAESVAQTISATSAVDSTPEIR